MRAAVLLLGLVHAVGCGKSAGDTSPAIEPVEDSDYDGFSIEDDCDDANPYIHPGAAETPGDSVDSDCDGQDGAVPYVGGYRLQTFMAGFSGFPILVEGSESGTLDVAEDLSMEMVVESTISPDAVGFPLPIVVELAGGTVPQIDPSHFVLEAEGLWNEEEVYVGWDCFLDAGELDCFGALKLLGYGFESEASFVAD